MATVNRPIRMLGEAEIEKTKALHRIADGLEAIATAIHRNADVTLYVNDPEGDEGERPASGLPDGFRGMR